ncbi:MAG: 3'-5' exonuclease [Chloroflexota bacterium]
MIDLDVPVNLVTFVAVDIETTGLDHHRDEIVEIGAAMVRGGRVVDDLSTLVYVDRTIPFQASRVSGIRNDMLVGAPRIEAAMAMLLGFCADGVMAEHSYKAFDVNFLERAYGARFDHFVNTCTLSRLLFPNIRKHSLEECCRRYHVTNQNQHRAAADARATAEVLIYLLKVGGSRFPRLSDLLRIAAVERN